MLVAVEKTALSIASLALALFRCCCCCQSCV